MNRGEAMDLILHSTLKPAERLVLLAYMSHLPSDCDVEAGKAWPGLERLQAMTGFKATATRSARQSLIDAGLLVRVGETDRGGLVLRMNLGPLRQPNPSARRTPPAAEPLREADPSARRGGTPSGNGGVPPRETDPNPPKRTLHTEPSPEKRAAGAARRSRSREVWEVWASRQPKGTAGELDPETRRLIIQALADGRSVAELQHLVAFAYDAPPGPSGVPERYALSWRGRSGLERPDLGMLLEPRRLARNLRMAAAWQPAEHWEPAPEATDLDLADQAEASPHAAAVCELATTLAQRGAAPPGGMAELGAEVATWTEALRGYQPSDVRAVSRAVSGRAWPSLDQVVRAAQAAATHRQSGAQVLAAAEAEAEAQPQAAR